VAFSSARPGDFADGLKACGEAWIWMSRTRSERFSLYSVAFVAYRVLSGNFVGIFACISIHKVTSLLFSELIL
jgi:nitrate reductase NapE component